jgi:hypothetical protein
MRKPYRFNEIDEIIELKNDIREKIAFQNKYEEALEDLKNYEKVAENEKIEKWFVMYNSSLANLKLNNSKQAIRLAKKSVKYSSNKEDYVKNLWLLDSCLNIIYLKMNSGYSKEIMLNKRVNIQQRCADGYRELMDDSTTAPSNKVKYRILQLTVMFNIAKLHNNLNDMLNVVQDINDLDDTILHNNLNKKDEKKSYLLFNTAKEIIDIYLENNDTFSCYKLINLIKDTQIKNNLKNILNSHKISLA